MKYNYQEVQAEILEGMRFYHTTKGSYPSITTVLSGSKSEADAKILEDWRDSFGHEAADAYSKKACDHGTAVHLLAERFLKNEEVEADIDGQPVAAEDLASFKALKMKLKKITAVWGQEVPLYSSVYQIAGRCDCVGTYKDVPVIIDFKTSGRVKKREDIADYELQLLFYGDSHNEMFGTNIQKGIILMAAGTMPMEFEVPFTAELRQKLRDRTDLFYKRLNDMLSQDCDK